MSKHETEATRRYWKERWKREGGTLIEEFPAVREKRDRNGRRHLDGVIVLDGTGRHLKQQDSLRVDGEILRKSKGNSLTHEVEIKGRKIIIVQTKIGAIEQRYRLGMYLLGQAFFSKPLMERFLPEDIRSVAVCGRHDSVMEKLAKEYGIEVVVYPPHEET